MKTNTVKKLLAKLDDFSEITEQIPPEKNTILQKAKQLKTEFDLIIKEGNGLMEDDAILKIGVVGQMNTGKSSFLNTLLFNGEDILPKAATAMTAGLTILGYNEHNFFEVEFYSEKEWNLLEEYALEYNVRREEIRHDNPTFTEDDIRKRLLLDIGMIKCTSWEMVNQCKPEARRKIGDDPHIEKFMQIDEMKDSLKQYVGVEGLYMPVTKCLRINLNDERLKGIQVIDTPGVNDPVVSRNLMTINQIRSCHGVFLLSHTTSFCDNTDMDFLNERISGEGIGQVVILAAKFDLALTMEAQRYHNNLKMAIPALRKTLRERMIKVINDSGFTGETPLFDVCSAISYTISTRQENQWSEEEALIVENVKDDYPTAFPPGQPTEELQKIFLNISNIPDIQQKCLHKFFKERKQIIIENKLDNYFRQKLDYAKKEIQELYQSTHTRHQEFRNENIGQIEELVNHLKSQQKEIMNSFINAKNEALSTVQDDLKDTVKRVDLTGISIPGEKVEGTYYRPGIFKSSNTKTHRLNIEDVDIFTLIRRVNEKVQNISGLSDRTSRLVKSMTKDLVDKMHRKISEMLQNNYQMDGLFWRNLLEGKVKTISTKTILYSVELKLMDDLKQIAESLSRENIRLPSRYHTFGDPYTDDEDALKYFNEKLSSAKSNARNELRYKQNRMNEKVMEVETKFNEEIDLAIEDFTTSFINAFQDTLGALLAEKQQEHLNHEKTDTEYATLKELFSGYLKDLNQITD